MNTVDIEQIRNEVNLVAHQNTVQIKLVPVETVQYGLMGIQPYEGVEVIEPTNNN